MERIQLKAKAREEIGKKNSKALRKEGLVPAVVYKEKQDTVHIQLNTRDLATALSTKAGENVLINLNIEAASKGKGKTDERVVIIKEIQHHPIKDQVLHVDFQEISLTEKLEVNVPIAVRGEAEGVVKDEGILEHIMWELKVECLPTDIPEKIEVDVTAMKIGDHILVKDLKAPEGVTILDDAELTVLAVVAPREEEPVAAPEGEVTEPELIREKKEKEEAEEGAPEAEGEAGEKESK